MIPGKAIPGVSGEVSGRGDSPGEIAGLIWGASYRMPEPYRPGKEARNGLVKSAGERDGENKGRMPGRLQGG